MKKPDRVILSDPKADASLNKMLDELYSKVLTKITESNTFLSLGDGSWSGTPIRLGAYYLWVDGSGRLRIKNGPPTNDSDGTIVGVQS